MTKKIVNFKDEDLSVIYPQLKSVIMIFFPIETRIFLLPSCSPKKKKEEEEEEEETYINVVFIQFVILKFVRPLVW